MSPRRATHFSLLRQRKVSKRKATLLSVSPALRSGATCDARAGGVPWNSLRAGALRSDSHGKLDNEACVSCGTHAHPLRCASRHGQKGTRESNSQTGHRCARPRRAQALCAAQRQAERSDGTCGLPPLVAAPAAGRLRGGMRVGARMLRELNRRGCSSAARQRVASSTAHPASAPPQVCPFATRRGRRLGVAFFCLLFLARQEKKVPRRGHIPASAHSKTHCFENRLWDHAIHAPLDRHPLPPRRPRVRPGR